MDVRVHIDRGFRALNNQSTPLVPSKDRWKVKATSSCVRTKGSNSPSSLRGLGKCALFNNLADKMEEDAAIPL